MGESTDSGPDGDDRPEEKSEAPSDEDSGTTDHDGDDDDAELDKKRKWAVVPLEFSLYKSWDLAQHETANIYAAIRVELAEINAAAGLMNIKTVQQQAEITYIAIGYTKPTGFPDAAQSATKFFVVLLVDLVNVSGARSAASTRQ